MTPMSRTWHHRARHGQNRQTRLQRLFRVRRAEQRNP